MDQAESITIGERCHICDRESCQRSYWRSAYNFAVDAASVGGEIDISRLGDMTALWRKMDNAITDCDAHKVDWRALAKKEADNARESANAHAEAAAVL